MLVLREKTNRKGETKAFAVVRAEADAATIEQAVDGIKEGAYKVFDGASVKSVNVSYRTVQDVEVN